MQKKTAIAVQKIEDIYSDNTVEDSIFLLMDEYKPYIKIPDNAIIIIKVNLCLLLGPETGATVDPRVVKYISKWLLKSYNLKEIIIAESDATHLSADMAFKILGWEEVFKNMERVRLFNLSKDDVVDVPVNSDYQKSVKMSKKFMEADYLISLAKLKTHIAQKITCIMKNQFGALTEKYKIIHHPRLAEAICDATAARMPDLCFIDGLIGMEGCGPTDGIPKKLGLLLIGNDAISTDHFCARLMGFRPKSVPHIKLAIKRGLGNINYEIVGETQNIVNYNFKFMPKWELALRWIISLIRNRAKVDKGYAHE